jgi:hypothetical protein
MKFKKIRESLLIVLAAVFGLLVVWASVGMTTFLIKRMDESLSFGSKSPRASEFDTAGFEKLHLIQETRPR